MTTEIIDHPPHYQTDSGIEAIEVMERYGLGPHLFVAMKHLLRAGKKGDVLTDLKKADWYMSRLFTWDGVALCDGAYSAEDSISPDAVVAAFGLTGAHADAVAHILRAAEAGDEAPDQQRNHLALAFRALSSAITEAEAAKA
jgi:hypothetical protein